MSNPKATKIRDLVKKLPLEHLVLETDAPDMLPSFATEKRNSPENLRKLFTILVELRSETAIETAIEIEEQLFKNSSIFLI